MQSLYPSYDSYDYGYDPGYSTGFDGVLGELLGDGTAIAMAVLGLVAILYLVTLGIAVASYVISSSSLYTIAKRRKISGAGLAWLPIANFWLVGKVADHYDEKNGIQRKWRAVLLTLALIFYLGYIVIYAIMFVAIIGSAANIAMGASASSLVGTLIFVYVGLIGIMMAGIALTACNYICLYKIFESTRPEKAVKYMLISILVPLGKAICLACCKNHGYYVPDYVPAQPAPEVQPEVETQPEQTV